MVCLNFNLKTLMKKYLFIIPLFLFTAFSFSGEVKADYWDNYYQAESDYYEDLYYQAESDYYEDLYYQAESDYYEDLYYQAESDYYEDLYYQAESDNYWENWGY